MSDIPSREMTLEEWVATLPVGHLARKELAQLEAENKELEECLGIYANSDEWSNAIHICGENIDGTEWEFDYYLDTESQFNRNEHGWFLAQTTLALLKAKEKDDETE